MWPFFGAQWAPDKAQKIDLGMAYIHVRDSKIRTVKLVPTLLVLRIPPVAMFQANIPEHSGYWVLSTLTLSDHCLDRKMPRCVGAFLFQVERVQE